MAKYKAKTNTKEVEKGKKTDSKAKSKTASKQVNNTKKTAVTSQKKAKVKKISNSKVLTDEQIQIRSFFIILVIIVALVVGLYFLSKVIVNKNDTNTNTTQKEDVKIAYDIASVGMILNRPYDEYYVMVYDSTITDAMYYSSLITRYTNKEDSLKIYFVDLNNRLNKEYASNKETGNNAVTNNVSDFSFGKVTLLRVKNSSVVSYYEDIDTIESILK